MGAPRISCAFNSSLRSHEHAAVAEQLGFSRAWFYDSPALYADVWVQLCRAAEHTDRIGLGPSVVVPSLRNPMVTASAIATLSSIAGSGRIAVGVGTGFTGRKALGQRPQTWQSVVDYVRVVRTLLLGSEAQWDGASVKMLHHPDFAPERPIDVPFLLAVRGPKGIAAAHEVADGVLGVATPVTGFEWSAVLIVGTVLDEGEDPGSGRVLTAAGPAAAMQLHSALELGLAQAIPGGQEWSRAYESIEPHRRHLAIHEGHLATVTDRDRPFVNSEVLTRRGVARAAGEWRDHVAVLAEQGATEIVYQPVGPDIPRELDAFASAVMP